MHLLCARRGSRRFSRLLSLQRDKGGLEMLLSNKDPPPSSQWWPVTLPTEGPRLFTACKALGGQGGEDGGGGGGEGPSPSSVTAGPHSSVLLPCPGGHAQSQISSHLPGSPVSVSSSGCSEQQGPCQDIRAVRSCPGCELYGVALLIITYGAGVVFPG